MNPIIYQLGNAHVLPWMAYLARSDEKSLYTKKNITKAELRNEFRKELNATKSSDAAISITALQHPGIKYGPVQEDKCSFSSMLFNDILTLEEILNIITTTMQELAQEIHRKQASDEILFSGCTFSGVFIFQHTGKNYAISIQLGDGRIGAIIAKQTLDYIPLEEVHEFRNPNEGKRILQAILTNHQAANVSSLMIEIQAIANFSQNDIIEIGIIQERALGSNGAAIVGQYLSEKVTVLAKSNVYAPFKSDDLARMIKTMTQPTDPSLPYVHSFIKIIEDFLMKKNPSPAVAIDYLNAICSCMNQNISYIDSDMIWQLAPTRTFGNLKIHAQGGHSYVPELKIYELPNQPMILSILSDGVTNFVSPSRIKQIATFHHGPDVNNPFAKFDAYAFAMNLLYEAYVKSADYCDNMTGVIVSLLGKPLPKDKATFAMVADGHGNPVAHNDPQHVVNYVQATLGNRLEKNITAALKQRMDQQAMVPPGSMDNLPLFKQRAASVGTQPIGTNFVTTPPIPATISNPPKRRRVVTK